MFIDKQSLVKKVVAAVNDCLLGKAEKDYQAAFEAIEGMIPKFVTEVSEALDGRFSN